MEVSRAYNNMIEFAIRPLADNVKNIPLQFPTEEIQREFKKSASGLVRKRVEDKFANLSGYIFGSSPRV